MSLVDELTAENLRLKETVKRLNRRCQHAEAAMASMKEIVSIKPEEGVRYVRGSVGRAFLAYDNAQLRKEIEALKFQAGMLMTMLRRSAHWGMTGLHYHAAISAANRIWVDGGMRFPLPELPAHMREHYQEKAIGEPPKEDTNHA